MSPNFLLISHPEESLWYHNVVNALAALGGYQVLPVKEAMQHILQHQYDMIIIDKASVGQEMLLVSRIRAQQSQTRIIAVTSTPTWRQIREILKAGGMDYLSKSMSEREYLAIFKDNLAKSPPPWPPQ